MSLNKMEDMSVTKAEIDELIKKLGLANLQQLKNFNLFDLLHHEYSVLEICTYQQILSKLLARSNSTSSNLVPIQQLLKDEERIKAAQVAVFEE